MPMLPLSVMSAESPGWPRVSAAWLIDPLIVKGPERATTRLPEPTTVLSMFSASLRRKIRAPSL